MDISSVNSDLIRGNVTTIILSSLWSGDRYGYDILKEIETKSESQYKLKQPTLYSVLKRLEKQGLIESYLGEPEDTGGGRRRYYSLTVAGREYLEKERREYEFSRTILDKLVSDTKFDLEKETAPFNISELRPYTKNKNDAEANTKQPETENTIIKEVIKERVVFKFIDSATGKEFDPNANPTAPQIPQKEIVSEAIQPILQPEAATLNSQSANQNQNTNSNIGQPKIFEVSPNAQTTLEQQQLSPIMQAVSDAQKEENAFTNRLDALGENKSIHPHSPARTLIDVFNDIEKRENIKSNENIVSKESEVISSEQKTSENISHNHASLLDILAQKEEERELAKQHIAASTIPTEEKYAASEKPAFSSSNLHSQSASNTSYAQQTAFVAAGGQKDTEFVSSFVLPRKKEEFSFEKEEIDYKGLLGNITEKHNDREMPVHPTEVDITLRSSDAELKTRLYAKGFKVRPYTKANTTEYYSFNFILSNRLNRDCFLLILISYIAMIGIMWAATATKVHYSVYLSFLFIGLALYAIPLGLFMSNPSKRVRANFNFKLSMLNRTMLCIELAVITMLIGFFLVGADVNNVDSLIAPIIVPCVLLLNLPLSSVVYYALYKTKKYHIA
ncbi:MAG: PadR family transcriptional regulator [Clostridia bacterium]|nr:PadR family transcriptional regulator [Clostridia bacterium]